MAAPMTHSLIVIPLLRDFFLFTGHNAKFVSPGYRIALFIRVLAWGLQNCDGARSYTVLFLVERPVLN